MGISVDDNLYELLQSNIPVVLLDLNLTGPNATYITSDNVSGAKKAVKHLKELGHQDIGMIGGLKDTFPTKTRSEVFAETKRNGLTVRDEWIIYTSYNEEGGYRAMTRMLKSRNCLQQYSVIVI